VGYSDIVKIITYVVNYQPEHRAIIGKARAPFFANVKPPASTPVGVELGVSRPAVVGS
jgi:hypothetical protein